MTASTSAMKILIDKFMKITPWVLRTSRMRDQSLAAIYFRICMIDNANSLLQFFIIEKRAGDVHWHGISIRYTYIVCGQCGKVLCIIVNRIRFLDTISLRIILLIIAYNKEDSFAVHDACEQRAKKMRGNDCQGTSLMI